MITQRDRLAAVLHDVCCEGYERDAGPHDSVDNVYADALLARGVRVVDVDDLERYCVDWLTVEYGAGERFSRDQMVEEVKAAARRLWFGIDGTVES